MESQGEDSGFAVSDTRGVAAGVVVGAEAVSLQIIGWAGDFGLSDVAEGAAREESSVGGVSAWWAVGSRQFWIRHVCAVSVESRVRGVAAEFSRVNGIRQEVPECGQWRVGPQDAG